MILNIHSDVSYLTEPQAHSCITGHYFLGEKPKNKEPISLNEAIYAFCGILKIVVAFTAEAESAALLFELHRRQDSLPHSTRIGPQTTTDTRAFQQQDRNRNKQQHCQEATITLNGDWIFFTTDQVGHSRFDVQWYPRTRKSLELLQ